MRNFTQKTGLVHHVEFAGCLLSLSYKIVFIEFWNKHFFSGNLSLEPGSHSQNITIFVNKNPHKSQVYSSMNSQSDLYHPSRHYLNILYASYHYRELQSFQSWSDQWWWSYLMRRMLWWSAEYSSDTNRNIQIDKLETFLISYSHSFFLYFEMKQTKLFIK